MLKENLIFFREFVSNFQSTGSAFPTTRWAAEALTTPLRGRIKPLSILEAGPGSGSVTVKILKDMLPGDTLMLCEINPRLMKSLKGRLATNKDFLRHKRNVLFYEGPVQELSEERRYDVIVCAIPFLNLPVELVAEIFAKFKKLSSDECVMTYYEYMGLRHASMIMSPPERRSRMRKLDSYIRDVWRNQLVDTRRVWLNMLPIHVRTLRLSA